MYFTNKIHQDNFQALLTKYPLARSDSQYQAGCYIVAHPCIYDHCNYYVTAGDHGPFDWYFEEESNPSPYKAGLSSGFLHLVKLGLNLYNNHRYDERCNDFSLYLALGTWGDELFNVFIEACRIRSGRLAA